MKYTYPLRVYESIESLEERIADAKAHRLGFVRIDRDIEMEAPEDVYNIEKTNWYVRDTQTDDNYVYYLDEYTIQVREGTTKDRVLSIANEWARFRGFFPSDFPLLDQLNPDDGGYIVNHITKRGKHIPRKDRLQDEAYSATPHLYDDGTYDDGTYYCDEWHIWVEDLGSREIKGH